MRPTYESIQELGHDHDKWLVGDRLLLSRLASPTDRVSWSDGDGSFYFLSESTPVGPDSTSKPLSEASCLQMVYDAGG